MTYETGYWGIPGRQGGRVHLTLDGENVCHEKPNKKAVFVWCVHGIALWQLTCDRCFRKALKIEEGIAIENRSGSKSEIWKSIPGWMGIYEASNLGRIRSLKKKCYMHILAMASDDDNRPMVDLCLEGKESTQKVGRLVLQAFVGECPNGCEMSHIDGNAKNNKLDNLIWESHFANMQRKKVHQKIRSCREEATK